MSTAGVALAAKRTTAAAVLDHVADGAEIVAGSGNAEPVTVLDVLEAAGASGILRDVRVHQMLPLRERGYFHGRVPGLRHVSWFLSRFVRDASASPPDEHGFFSLGTNADYIAALAGERPLFLEVNPRMPRTRGENQIHVRDIVGWCEADYALAELPASPVSAADTRIAELVAERIPDEATLQIGIGSVPERVIQMLRGHRRLGIHTELFPDGLVDLVESGAATGEAKTTHKFKAIATVALGSQRLYDFIDDNPGVELWPVDYTNDPQVIAAQHRMHVVNATLEVDFLGQCASESIGSQYWSSSGGQPDFARGALFSEGGQSFIVLHSANHDASVSRIVSRLHPGAAVTTFKNNVDKVVTEHGVAELRGQPIRERTRRLIAIAHPAFRDDLERQARELGYLT